MVIMGDKKELLAKADSVLRSCNSIYQIPAARRYMNLVNRRVYGKACFWNEMAAVGRTENKIYDHISRLKIMHDENKKG